MVVFYKIRKKCYEIQLNKKNGLEKSRNEKTIHPPLVPIKALTHAIPVHLFYQKWKLNIELLTKWDYIKALYTFV